MSVTKILMVSPYRHNGVHSGASKRIINIANQMAELGVSVSVIAPFNGFDERVNHTSAQADSLLGKITLIGRIIFYTRTVRFNAVVSEFPFTPWALISTKAFFLLHDDKAAVRPGWRNKLRWAIQRFAVDQSDAVITVSMAMLEKFVSFGIKRDKVFVSYNGISDNWLLSPYRKREKLFDVLYVANFAAHKNHKFLLNSLVGFKGSVCFVGGDFGEELNVRNLAREREINSFFYSNLSEEALIDIVDRSHVVAFPSLNEGFGMPVLEAAVRGKTCLVFDLDCFRELSGNLRNVRIIPDNTASFRKAIDQELAKPYYSGQPCPEVEQVFSWRHITCKLLDYLLAG